MGQCSPSKTPRDKWVAVQLERLQALVAQDIRVHRSAAQSSVDVPLAGGKLVLRMYLPRNPETMPAIRVIFPRGLALAHSHPLVVKRPDGGFGLNLFQSEAARSWGRHHSIANYVVAVIQLLELNEPRLSAVDLCSAVVHADWDSIVKFIFLGQDINERAPGPSNMCLYLTEKCDFDGGFLSNFSDNWQG